MNNKDRRPLFVSYRNHIDCRFLYKGDVIYDNSHGIIRFYENGHERSNPTNIFRVVRAYVSGKEEKYSGPLMENPPRRKGALSEMFKVGSRMSVLIDVTVIPRR